MKCDILIVSYRGDLHWLSYCLRFLNRNWKEDSRIIVRLEEDCREIVQGWSVPNVEFYYVKPWPDGYGFQMYQKMLSDDYTDAEFILCVDSDVMLVAPADLDELMKGPKPIIYYREWNEEGEEVAQKVWRGPTTRALGIDLDRDYMVYGAPLYWRETFQKTRSQIVRTTMRSFFDAVYSDTPFRAENFMEHPMKFCDFECLSLYAAKFESQRYALVHADDRLQYCPFRQYWSHGSLTPEIQNELEALLAAK